MERIANAVVKHRRLIIIVCLLLLIPSVFGMAKTRVNYDMLKYLPKDIETVKGQDTLLDDFGKGAFVFIMVDGMSINDVSVLKEKVENVEHVDSVIWYDSLLETTVPMELLPKDVYDAFNNGDTTLMAVFFDTSVSSDETMAAIKEIRQVANKQCFISGMSAYVTDLKDLAEQEEPIYVALAVAIAIVLLSIFMDSFLIPFLFLASIGMAILYNLGSNIFLGEISYITKAISAVLQLGVTMDYSIFLWHSYKENKETFKDPDKSMVKAIKDTITSVTGSSITTIAGFIALCFMSFTLGRDLGIVMAKGVVFGVIASVTLLPSFILVFDKLIEKTAHKPLMFNPDRLSNGITKHYKIITMLFIVIMVPALFGYLNTPVYYNLDKTLPDNLDCVKANAKLNDEFNMDTCQMILLDSELEPKDVQAMTDEIEDLDGVKLVMGQDSLLGVSIPKEILPDSVGETLEANGHQLLIFTSEYRIASDELNNQIDQVNNIIHKYDNSSMLIGEGPCTKDLISITNHDFNVVSAISIAAIFIIILLVLKSISIPVILVAVIEFAIFINLGIPYYQGVELPFIAGICISTIQLGATVDYAILMTNRYKLERLSGHEKRESITTALSKSMPSIIVSALCFFGATVGVGIYSDIDMIGTMCSLMARGAIISMIAVIFVLPSLLMIFDRLVIKTTKDMRQICSLKKAE